MSAKKQQPQADEMGLNELHTTLRSAVEKEDYLQAGQISDILLERLYGDVPENDDERKWRRRKMSWKGLGAAPWLTDRLDALGYTFPTTIQINAMEAVNAILNATDEMVESTSLEERVGINKKDLGVVISGTTGSGKSLAYLVALLSTLSDSLFMRQRIRVGAEEMVGDTTGNLLDRVAVVTSPVIRSTGRKQLKQGGAIATGASMATLGKSGKDVKYPLALIVVPTRELGIQTAMLCYQLVGGSIKDSATDFSGRANMFKYKGPKGIRIACVLDDQEASFGIKLQTDIAITTPEYLGKLLSDGDVDPSKLRVAVYDEADLALEQTEAGDLSKLFDDNKENREYSRLVFLVGASVTEALGSLAVSSRVLPEGNSWIATATRFAALSPNSPAKDASQIFGSDPKTASLQDLNICLYPGLKHERVIVSDGGGLLALTRLLRKELQDYEDKASQRPRVVVFFPDEPQAKAAIEPLRDAMWGEHKLCVLLPKTGFSPLTIMEQFKKNETTVMLATPNSVRGLDFPALTHVYTLYLPIDDPREYVHLAGRVGRVGQVGRVLGDGAHVVSILKKEDAGKMEELAQKLGFEFEDIDVESAVDDMRRDDDGELDTESLDIDKMRRYLEDTLTLLGTTEEPVVDTDAIDARANAMEDGPLDDEDVDDDVEASYQ
jgi:superfamily II DNA/RNA helicase